MTEQILSLLNPVRILKVNDWEEIARITLQNEEAANAFDAQAYLDRRTVHTIMRFEQLASKPLTKEMFVCAVKPPDVSIQDFDESLFAEHTAALKAVWFDGLKATLVFPEVCSLLSSNGDIQILIGTGNFVRLFINGYAVCESPTLFDLLYHITKYNETSDTKIDLRFTESFAEELLK